MKVLYISNKPLYPKVDGGTVAMSSFLDLLLSIESNDVIHLCFSTPKHPFILDNYPEYVRNSCQIESAQVDTSIRKIAAFKSLLKNESYHLKRFENSSLRSRILSLCKEHSFDVIIGESIYSLQAIQNIPLLGGKTICRTHNIEHNIWQNLSRNSSGIKKWYLSQLAKSLKKEETKLLKSLDGILTLSLEDLDGFKKLGIDTPMDYLPVTIKNSDYCVDYTSNKFHHLGAMNWQPNIELVNDLITLIFPKIRAKLPDSELHLAGSYFPDNIQSNPQKGIFVHGFVEDMHQFHNNYGIQLVPLKSGSGIRIKLLESMAIGVPNITTKKGAEGIDYQINDSLIVTNSIDELIDKAVELAKNVDLRQKIGQNAKKHIDTTFSFEIGRKKLIEFIRKIS